MTFPQFKDFNLGMRIPEKFLPEFLKLRDRAEQSCIVL